MRHHNGVYTQKLNVDQIGGRAYGANAAAAVDRAKELMAWHHHHSLNTLAAACPDAVAAACVRAINPTHHRFDKRG